MKNIIKKIFEHEAALTELPSSLNKESRNILKNNIKILVNELNSEIVKSGRQDLIKIMQNYGNFDQYTHNLHQQDHLNPFLRDYLNELSAALKNNKQ